MKHPIQKLCTDSKGVVRFVKNNIVRFMLDAGKNGWKFDLNSLSEMDFDEEDFLQLRQLIGYSVDGFIDFDVPEEMQNEIESARGEL